MVPERLIRMVMALYSNTRSRVRVAGETSEYFDIGVGVHQGSTLSPLLFILVMEEATKDCSRGDPWDLLYADDLALTAASKEEVVEAFEMWRDAMAGVGFKVNTGKTKIMVTGKKIEENVEVGRYPCGVCGRGVGANSVLCVECRKWCHQRCSGLQRLGGVRDFQCPACARRERGEVAIEMVEEFRSDGEMVEEVKTFRYLGDVIDSEGGVERAVRARVASAWNKWREISALLRNEGVPLVHRGAIYEMCIRPVLLYGGENWALTDRVRNILITCDRKMLRYMAGISWEDRVCSDEVARRCGLVEIDRIITAKRLRWFGHVKRRMEDEPLGRVRGVEVAGGRPRGRPKMTWMKSMEGTLRSLGLSAEDALDRETWRATVDRLTSRN
jgi:hypothetical protein